MRVGEQPGQASLVGRLAPGQDPDLAGRAVQVLHRNASEVPLTILVGHGCVDLLLFGSAEPASGQSQDGESLVAQVQVVTREVEQLSHASHFPTHVLDQGFGLFSAEVFGLNQEVRAPAQSLRGQCVMRGFTQLRGVAPELAGAHQSVRVQAGQVHVVERAGHEGEQVDLVPRQDVHEPVRPDQTLQGRGVFCTLPRQLAYLVLNLAHQSRVALGNTQRPLRRRRQREGTHDTVKLLCVR